MQTIVEPKANIYKLWGKQRIRDEDTYRRMKYTLQAEHDGNVLLHNVVTGQLVILNPDEAALMEKLPFKHCSEMDQMIEDHFLVPDLYEESHQVTKIREVLRKLENAKQKPYIAHYTILPTTACNARCYYCFERGSRIVTMTEQTAQAVADFIIAHCNDEKSVSISWFGGEPTVAHHRIDQICQELKNKDVRFTSDLITNGYLFDEEMARKAKTLWNTTRVQITVDGTENTYNRIKAYADVCDSPYKRVLDNIGRLMENGIRVGLRMNFDIGNYREFENLLKELKDRYSDRRLLQVYVHPVIGEHPDVSGKVIHADDAWFDEKILELNGMARELGLLSPKNKLPYLRFRGCQASNDEYATITPEGYLVSCPEQYGEDQIIGNIWDGITNYDTVNTWKEFSEYPRCIDCVLFPDCSRLKRCSAKDRCCYMSENMQQYRESMKHKLCSYKSQLLKEERS